MLSLHKHNVIALSQHHVYLKTLQAKIVPLDLVSHEAF
jgi:hypothetical protein